MTRLTRNFLFGGSLVMLVGLCTGLVAYYNGGMSLLSNGRGPSDLSYLPAGTTVVAYANVDEIMKSEFRKHIQAVLPTGEEKERLQSETGIDLERDIDSVVAGFGGHEAGPKAAADSSVVIVRGRFDEKHITDLATAHGGTVETYKGVHLIAAPDANVGGHGFEGAVAFIGPNVVALGGAGAVRRAIDAHESHENVTSDDEMMKFVGDVDKRSNAWIAGRFASLASTGALPQIARDKLSTVQWFAVSAHVDGGVNGIIRADARDDQAGEDLRSIVRGALAAVRLFSNQNPKLDTAINSLQLGGNGKTVSLAFNVPPEAVDMVNGVAGLANLGSGKSVRK